MNRKFSIHFLNISSLLSRVQLSIRRDNVYVSPKTYAVLAENKCWSSYKRIRR